MKNHQNLTLLFWHRKSKADNKGFAPVICRISIDGEPEEEISTGKKVQVTDWDIANKKANGNSKEAREVNLKISELTVDLTRYFTVLQTQHEKITPLMLKNIYQGKPADQEKMIKATRKVEELNEEKTPSPTFLQAVDLHINNFEKMVRKDLRSHESLKQWRSTRKKIIEFLLFQYGLVDMELGDIQYSFATNFYNYLTLERKKVLQDAAAKKQLKNTKEVLKFAEQSNWIVKNPIAQFKCSAEEKEVEPLEFFEVEQIWRKEIRIQRLAEVRDAFIFQCFTGFAFQDVYALNTENIIQVGVSGERWLLKQRGKTKVAEMVPIMPIVEEILRRYEQHPCRTDYKRLIPVNSNCRYNAYLKELAVICGITRDLNTHLARHTFADIMLNIMQFSLAEVSRMLGHKIIRTTQRYARVRKQLISKTFASQKTVLFTDDGQLRKVG